jgi:hypothetical protein
MVKCVALFEEWNEFLNIIYTGFNFKGLIAENKGYQIKSTNGL